MLADPRKRKTVGSDLSLSILTFKATLSSFTFLGQSNNIPREKGPSAVG
jgi:hypothetical protein